MRISVQVYPNRELRVIVGPDRPVREVPSPPKGLLPPSGVEGLAPPKQRAESGTGTLDISSELKTDYLRVRSGYGQLGGVTQFGVNARRTLMRAGGVFDLEKIRPQEVMFLTGTLPGGTVLAKTAIAAWSSWLVNGLKAWISKYCSDSYSLYVWELQERGALHIHYAVHVPDPGARIRLYFGFHRWWVARMHLLSSQSGVDVFEWANGRGSWKDRPDVVQARAEVCRKSPSRYLAKYASKPTGKAVRASADGCMEVFAPVRWWGVSRPLMRALRKYSHEHTMTGLTRSQARGIAERLESLLCSEHYSTGGAVDEINEGMAGPMHRYRDKSGNYETMVAFGRYRYEAEVGNMLGPKYQQQECVRIDSKSGWGTDVAGGERAHERVVGQVESGAQVQSSDLPKKGQGADGVRGVVADVSGSGGGEAGGAWEQLELVSPPLSCGGPVLSNSGRSGSGAASVQIRRRAARRMSALSVVDPKGIRGPFPVDPERPKPPRDWTTDNVVRR